jgi:hypothetical protein
VDPEAEKDVIDADFVRIADKLYADGGNIDDLLSFLEQQAKAIRKAKKDRQGAYFFI